MSYPPTALSTISGAALQALTYKPLLLIDVAFVAGITYSGFPAGVTYAYFSTDTITWNGNTYLGCVTRNTLDAVQKMTSIGIDANPRATVELADPGADLFAQYELEGTGFKGATVTMTLIMVDKITGAISSDSKIKFIGRAYAPSINDTILSFAVRSKLDLSATLVPNVPISKLCPYPFPGTADEQADGSDPTSQFYPCGYPGGSYTDCNYDIDSCVARGMFSQGRFGAVEWEPPVTWSNPSIYTSGQKGSGWNTDNQNKYQSYVPLVYGMGMVKGVVANVIGDGNTVRFEVIVGWGDITGGAAADPDGGVQLVIVNDVGIPHNPQDPYGAFGATGVPDPAFMWQYVNRGQRNGTPGGLPPWNSQGDPYGSMAVIAIVVPTTVVSNSNTVPDVLVFLREGKSVRVYTSTSPVTDSTGTYTVQTPYSNPIWSVMDLLVTGGPFRYTDFNIATAIAAAAICDITIPFTGVSGPYAYVDVLSDGVSVQVDPSNGQQNNGVFVTSTVVVGGGTNYTSYAGVALGQLIQINYQNTYIQSFVNEFELILASPGVTPNQTNVQMLASHHRYRLNLVIQTRQPLSDLLNGIKQACNLNLTINNQTNQLEFYVDQGIGDQQGSPVTNSNDTTAYPSYLATGANAASQPDGTTGTGYSAYLFSERNILLTGKGQNLQSSLKIIQQPAPNTPNRIITPFQNEEIQCESDTSTRVDTDDYQRIQTTFEAQVRMEGAPNFDQLFRRANNYMARNFRGNPRSPATYGDTGGTITVEFQTPGMKVPHLRVGHIISLASLKFGWGYYDPTTGIAQYGQLFRIQAIAVDDNFDIATINAAWHDDRWFLDGYGSGPSPQFALSANTLLLRPPMNLVPYGGQQPLSGDTVYTDLRYWFPGMRLDYELNADKTVTVQMYIYSQLPVNSPSVNVNTPYISFQGAVDVSTGSVPAGIWYVAVIAQDTNGNLSLPQPAPQMCRIPLATTGSLIVPRISWGTGTNAGYWFIGNSPTRMYWGGEIVKSGGVIPAGLKITSIEGGANPANNPFPIPDVRLDHVEIDVKEVFHAGIIGVQLNSVATNVVSIAAVLTVNQLVGYRVGVVAWPPNSTTLEGLFDATITGNDNAGNLTLDLDPAANGVVAGCVLIVYFNFSVSTVDGNTVLTDPNMVNSTGAASNYLALTSWYLQYPSYLYTEFNTYPVPHGFANGETIVVEGFTDPTLDYVGTVQINGPFGFFFTGLPWNGVVPTYTPYVVAYNEVGFPVNSLNGDILRVIHPDGTSYTTPILSNTTTSITTNGLMPQPPQSTDICIVEESSWHEIGQSGPQNISIPGNTVSLNIEINNWEGKQILTQMRIVAGDGTYSADSGNPLRLSYVIGATSNVSLLLNYIGLVPDMSGNITIDLSRGTVFFVQLPSGPTPSPAITILAPVYTNGYGVVQTGAISAGMEFELYLQQPDTPNNNSPTPTFTTGSGGFSTDYNGNQFSIDGTANSVTTYHARYHGTIWGLTSFRTGGFLS